MRLTVVWTAAYLTIVDSKDDDAASLTQSLDEPQDPVATPDATPSSSDATSSSSDISSASAAPRASGGKGCALE